ncbi:MAG TPA: flagellar hook protein FlgE [Burkholderiales bacterium]|nr:flagellar hook protein FlgE [Burkholderiales bacterium]
MSFQQGLSGLNAASKSLDVIGNNVANANTIGFKMSEAEFADVFANSLNGSGGTQVGIGTTVRAISQEFSQGNITVTNNPLDIAVNGKGFYRMSNNGAITYSRNGQFQLDKDGYVVNSENARLTGYAASAAGVLDTSAPRDLRIAASDSMPSATTTVNATVNLDSRETPKGVAFSITNPNSYNSSTSVATFDSLGNSHTLSLYFARAAASNTWDVYAASDNASVPLVSPATPVGRLVFAGDGTLNRTASTMPAISVTGLTNGANNMSYTVDFTGTTQFGSAFGVNSLAQNGYTSGRLSGLNISADGVIQGRYTNGQSSVLGQVTLANFANTQNLQPAGGNSWAETAESGAAMIGAPGSGTLGVLQSAAVEDSNVDLTAELVNMITAQRVYQANAQSIKTQDAVLQTLVNLR